MSALLMEKLKTQHNGTESLAINNTWLRRFSTLLALMITSRFYSRRGVCVPISKHKIVKTGPTVHLTEAATMKFVSENTSIPVPKIYCSFVWGNRAYIVMERVKGECVTRTWKTLSEESRRKIGGQLKLMIQELRSLPPPGTGVESCSRGSLRDSRIPKGFPRFGPFKTIQEFHRWLRGNFQLSEINPLVSNEERQELKEMVSIQDGPWPPPVFTHGDLNPTNIFVRGDQVVGIIDWEFSGWYPNYWEYASAWCGNATTSEWQDQLDTFLDRPAELKMEITRQKWWGE